MAAGRLGTTSPQQLKELADYLSGWIFERVKEAGSRGVIFGLSGGIDSAVVAGLCKRAAIGGLLGLIMPCHSNPEDKEDALSVAESLRVPVEIIDLSESYDRLLSSINPIAQGAGSIDPSRERLARANLKVRLRMITLYFHANRLGYLVAGTGNKSELTVGYFTKYGDGGVDILPIGGLVKAEVRKLARYLGVPEKIIEKPPSAGLWPDQTDESEMGLTYEALDRYILTGEAPDEIRNKIERFKAAAVHKRQPPPVPPDILPRR